jgi:hypothetical protein
VSSARSAHHFELDGDPDFAAGGLGAGATFGGEAGGGADAEPGDGEGCKFSRLRIGLDGATTPIPSFFCAIAGEATSAGTAASSETRMSDASRKVRAPS